MQKMIQIRPHAKRQLKERDIREDLVKKVLTRSNQILDAYSSRKIAQDIIKYKGEQFLIRVVYEETDKALEVVTVYLTSKIEKYWR